MNPDDATAKLVKHVVELGHETVCHGHFAIVGRGSGSLGELRLPDHPFTPTPLATGNTGMVYSRRAFQGGVLR